ncbi:hypothetical protein LJR289_001282 [Pseudoduganella sp. LjRoot289]|uniref:hypothetical protein n=1 Tax=Pseudoduganella sp. LjRoot289 TaxID=3342314 RepID=UPI003ED0B404
MKIFFRSFLSLIFVHKWARRRQMAAPVRNTGNGGLMGEFSAQIGVQEYAFDDIGPDIVGLEILYRAQGAEAVLHRYALVDDLAAAQVLPLLRWRQPCGPAGKGQGIHRHPSRVGRAEKSPVKGVSNNKSQSQG